MIFKQNINIIIYVNSNICRKYLINIYEKTRSNYLNSILFLNSFFFCH